MQQQPQIQFRIVPQSRGQKQKEPTMSMTKLINERIIITPAANHELVQFVPCLQHSESKPHSSSKFKFNSIYLLSLRLGSLSYLGIEQLSQASVVQTKVLVLEAVQDGSHQVLRLLQSSPILTAFDPRLRCRAPMTVQTIKQKAQKAQKHIFLSLLSFCLTPASLLASPSELNQSSFFPI